MMNSFSASHQRLKSPAGVKTSFAPPSQSLLKKLAKFFMYVGETEM